MAMSRRLMAAYFGLGLLICLCFIRAAAIGEAANLDFGNEIHNVIRGGTEGCRPSETRVGEECREVDKYAGLYEDVDDRYKGKVVSFSSPTPDTLSDSSASEHDEDYVISPHFSKNNVIVMGH